MGSLGSMAMAVPWPRLYRLGSGRRPAPRSAPAAQEPQLVGAQLGPGEPAAGHRVVGDDGLRRLLVGGLEDPDPGVDLPEGGAGQDQHPVGQQPPQPGGVGGEGGPLLVGHGRREVVPRRVQEVDPLGHGPSMVVARTRGQTLPAAPRSRGRWAAGRRAPARRAAVRPATVRALAAYRARAHGVWPSEPAWRPWTVAAA